MRSTLRAVPKGAARTFRFLAWMLAGVLSFMPSFAQPGAAATWKLLVCADRDNLPYSDAFTGGFENRIAELLAGELGAELSYAWMPENHRGSDGQLMLRHGECDVLPSMVDGQEPFLTTVSYYTAASYFVTRVEDGLDIESLDDPQLPSLRIGVDRSSPVDFALLSRVAVGDLRHYGVGDPPDGILHDVLSGKIDVGIVRGAVAGYFITVEDLPLKLKPVTPEIDIPFLALVQPMTMGLRHGDDELRDLLNRAILSRWDDIQGVLQEFGVVRRMSPAGTSRVPALPVDELRIGLILPVRTGASPLFRDNIEYSASAAVRGAQLAAEQSGRNGHLPVRLLLGSAPTPEVAERSAERMVLADSAVAVIGGVGAGQAAALAGVAERLSVPFLNIADPDPELRSGDSESHTFNVAPAASTYLAAIGRQISVTEAPQVFVVQAATPLYGRVAKELSTCLDTMLPAGWLAGTAQVVPDLPFYGSVFRQIKESGATHAVLLLEADEQLVFTAQFEAESSPTELLPFPDPGTQLRQYYWTVVRDAPGIKSQARFAMWDSAIESEDFNDLYRSRWGEQPEAVAWTTFTAVRVLGQAADSAGAVNTEALLGALADSQTDFALGTEMFAQFADAGHQLQAQIYTLKLNEMSEGTTFPLAQLSRVVEIWEGNLICD